MLQKTLLRAVFHLPGLSSSLPLTNAYLNSGCKPKMFAVALDNSQEEVSVELGFLLSSLVLLVCWECSRNSYFDLFDFALLQGDALSSYSRH